MKQLSRILLIILLGFWGALILDQMVACAQDPNPQSGFAPTVLYAGPSTYLNFNDQTTSFLDQISGASFTSGATSTTFTVGAIVAPLAGGANNQIQFSSAPSPAGSLESVSVQYASAPASGQSLTVLIGSVSGSQVTIINSFTLTVASTTALQTFVTGTNFSPITMATGQIIGFWNGSGIGPAQGSGSSYQHYYTAASTYPTGTYSFAAYSSPPAISAVVQTGASGTVTPRQPGFDSTLLNNTSASFGWNTYATAPNNTLGAIEWSSPWSMMVQVDQLNWSRTGTLVLASKGDLATGNSWELYLQMTGQLSQLCFQRTGSGISNGVCTINYIDAMPNGFNYNIVVEDAGTGGPIQFDSSIPNPLTIYINGMSDLSPRSEFGIGGQNVPIAINGSVGFGSVNLSVSGGTGYANSTNFTSTGGGANCIVTGTMAAVSGVPTNTDTGSQNGYADLGCTSVPTIVLTSPTGTGVTITATLRAPSMNSTTSPLMVPGYVSGGVFYGIAGTTSTQPPVYIDEFAIFPELLSQSSVQGMFYWTKFYQGLLKTSPSSSPPLVVWDDDGCTDADNRYGGAVVIGAHRIGYVNPAVFINDTQSGTPTGLATGFYRQMLDSAGFSNTLLGVPSVPATGTDSGCFAANIATYNASTSISNSTYPQASMVYRTLLAQNPTRPVYFLLGGSYRGIMDLLQSPADSISSMTGAELWARDAANGGALYVEVNTTPPYNFGGTSPDGWNNASADIVSTQYLVENNGSMPIYFMPGLPQGVGPGVLSTRTSKDPFYLEASSLGSDYGDAWDILETVPFLTNYFTGSVDIAISGSGTGYANQTYFTSTGGGSTCTVTGIMVSSGGIPSSIIPIDGGTYGSSFGYGCLNPSSPPTINLTSPTGTGVVLTATTTATGCGTSVVTSTSGYGLGSASFSSCTNEYWVPFSQWATIGNTPVFTWFMNSLIDPPPNGRPLGVK